MDDQSRLVIGTLRSRYLLARPPEEGWHVRQRLDRIAQRQLPGALAARLEGLGEERGAVIRIRHLHVALALENPDVWPDGEIAAQWAKLLAAAIARALRQGSPADVRHYEDHADYVATFLSDLLAGLAHDGWMYEDFAPIRDLPPGRAAAHLFAGRPALLLPVARRLRERKQWEPLLTRFDPWDLALIWEQGVGAPLLADYLPDPLPLEALDEVPLERGADGARARNRLRLWVALRSRADPLPDPAAAALSHHLALLLWAVERQPAPWLWEALAAGEIRDSAAIRPVLARLGERGAPLERWLEAALPTREGRAYVARLLRALQPAPPAPGQSARPQGLASPYAGLALLLPSLRTLALEPRIGRAGLYQLLLEATGSRTRPLAWGDSGIAWLAGIDPREREAARLAPVAWPEPRPACLLRLLRHFAAGLRGFEESSPDFLASRFFDQPGSLFLSADALDVYLSRSPLAILLQMAGRAGEQGPIPWLGGRELRIHLP